MLFFIVALAAIVGLTIYIVKNTKAKPSSFLAEGETLLPEPVEEEVEEVVIEEAPKKKRAPRKPKTEA